MSDLSDKILSEFLELMKKVNNLDIQVQNIAKDHLEITDSCKKQIQGMQTQVSSQLQKQNILVTSTNDNIINQVNKALSTVNEAALSYVSNNYHPINTDKIDEIVEKHGEIQGAIDKINKTLSLISKAFSSEETKIQNEKKEIDPILSTKIEDLEFPVRIVNCLKAVDVFTLSDLIQKTWWDLKITPNLGGKSMKDIKEVLDKLGFNLAKGGYS